MHPYITRHLVTALLIASTTTMMKGASLTIGSGSAAPGSTISLPITVASTGGQVSGLQWTFTYSAAEVANFAINAGSAASQGAKSVECVGSPGQQACIVWGLNASAIPDGQLASITLTLATQLPAASSVIRVSNPVASSPDASPVALTANNATIGVTLGVARLASLSCSPGAVAVPGSASCTATLTGPAAASGASVTLGTGTTGSAVLNMPAVLNIPGGSTSGTFTVQVASASTASNVMLVATLNSDTRNFSLGVLPGSVDVTPNAATLTASQTLQFTAAISGLSGGLTWSRTPAIGTISSNGLFTAPSSVASTLTVVVKATSVADSSKFDIATITLVPTVTDRTGPVISSVTAAPGSSTAVIAWTTNEPSSSTVMYGASTTTLNLLAVDAALVTSHTVTVSGISPETTYYFRVISADAAKNSSTSPISSAAPATFRTTAVPPLPAPRPDLSMVTIWPATAAPAKMDDSDEQEVELGLRFYSDVPGRVTGVRFYKGTTENSGVHTGSLWNSAGTRLATVTFRNETSSGWQKADFATPVNILANVTYVISYYAPAGHYSLTERQFGAQVNSGVLHTAAGNNGVYKYGGSAFPNDTYRGSNYWVDVVFAPAAKAAYPSDIEVTAGSLDGGNAAALRSNDGTYVEVDSTRSPYNTEWYASFTGIPNKATSINVAYSGKNSRSCTETVSIWKWTNSTWVQLDSQLVATSEVLRAALVPPGSVADYVSGNAGAGEVRVRVACAASNRTFTASGDLMTLAYTE